MNNESMKIARRTLLGRCTGVSIGAMALASLLRQSLAAEESTVEPIGIPDLPHFAPRAKQVIFLTQSGVPSQIGTWNCRTPFRK